MDLNPPRTPARKGMPFWGWLILLLLGVCLLSACSSRGVAPVSERSKSSAQQRQVPRPGYYLVKPGDTLYSIAWRYRLNYRTLAAWNSVRGPAYRIYPGQSLRLSPPPRTASSVRSATQRSPRIPKETRPREAAVNQSKPLTTSKNQRPKKKSPGQSLKLDWQWPTKGRVVQTFSSKDPARKGVRIRGQQGQAVVAAERGKVVYSGSGLVGYGNLIIIKHNNNYLSAYGYNKKLLVKEGDTVSRGERIAQMGSPRNGTDPMLHFEIRKQGKPLDPLTLLKNR